jgi:RHS repeat-associated protein
MTPVDGRDSVGFTGHEHDDLLGVINMRGRIYEPLAQRFLSPDPLVGNPLEPQAWNGYSYVMNSPLAYVDPSGYLAERSTAWRPPVKAILTGFAAALQACADSARGCSRDELGLDENGTKNTGTEGGPRNLEAIFNETKTRGWFSSEKFTEVIGAEQGLYPGVEASLTIIEHGAPIDPALVNPWALANAMIDFLGDIAATLDSWDPFGTKTWLDRWDAAHPEIPKYEYGVAGGIRAVGNVGKAVKATRGAAGSSRALGRALEAAGHVRPVGSAAHHIVAAAAPEAAAARSVLQRFGIGLNDPVNGVFLPASRVAPNAGAAAVHSGVHTSAYYQAVNEALGAATTRQQAVDILGSIGQSLRSGAFP